MCVSHCISKVVQPIITTMEQQRMTMFQQARNVEKEPERYGTSI